jgi:Helix-turn-helix domain
MSLQFKARSHVQTGPAQSAAEATYTTPTAFLTTREAAHLLRLSEVTLSRWRTEGAGPNYCKFGRRVLSQTRRSTSERS